MVRLKATKHIWLRPITRDRVQVVQNRLQEMYQEDFYRHGLGVITLSLVVDWLIYRAGMPGNRYDPCAYTYNVWTEFYKKAVDEIIEGENGLS